MTDGLTSIITTLERQRAAIERALSALREVDGVPISPSIGGHKVSPRKGKNLSAAVRKRMQEAQRLRWARVRGKSEQKTSTASEPSTPKRRISAEGMKRIIAATKKRWALKRAETKAALEKAGPKKTAREKAALVKPTKTVKKSAPMKKAAKKTSPGAGSTEIPMEQL